jgi:hypothetical protein
MTIRSYAVPIVSVIGFIFNLLSTIVFSLIIKNGLRDDMYKYLLLKSICETLGCFFNLMSFNTIGFKAISTYIYTVWQIWFENYIIKALFMASTGFEIAATFNCAISIEKKMKWCQKRLSFWLWVVFILVLSFGVEIFPVFINYIQEFTFIDQFNKTSHKYVVWPNLLYMKSYGKFGLAENIFKEVLFFLILLSLNFYILFKLIQIGRRKKRLNTNSSNVQNSTRAENRKKTMIIFLFLIFLFGHLPIVIYYLVNRSWGAPSSWIHFLICGEILFYFSYSTSFFVYFAFNNIFRRLCLKMILHSK